MEVRLNRYLSEAGICSRRAADKLIEEGKVCVDGVVATMGTKVLPGQTVTYMGKVVKKEEERIILAFNKPIGVVCTAAKDDKNNIVDYIGYEKRVYPVGRLDKDSQGLILLTNDGELMNNILKVSNNHEKEYVVTVNKPVTEEFIKGMGAGVPILNTVTRKCRIWQTDERTFHIVLMQGLNRQIRRMSEYFGYKVVKLKRIRIMNIKLGNLPIGQYREIVGEELKELERML